MSKMGDQVENYSIQPEEQDSLRYIFCSIEFSFGRLLRAAGFLDMYQDGHKRHLFKTQMHAFKNSPDTVDEQQQPVSQNVRMPADPGI